jgi:hypothetical protein
MYGFWLKSDTNNILGGQQANSHVTEADPCYVVTVRCLAKTPQKFGESSISTPAIPRKTVFSDTYRMLG